MSIPLTQTDDGSYVLPDVVWVVTKERTRAGLPPLKVHPSEWTRATAISKPYGLRALSGNRKNKDKAKSYGLADCFLSAKEAVSGVAAVAERELQYAQSELNALKNKLRQAKAEAAALAK